MRRMLCGLGLVLAVLASLANLTPAAAAGEQVRSISAPKTIVGGKTVTVTIKLRSAAGENVTVDVSSTNGSIAPVSDVVIKKRKTSATLKMKTKPVTADQTVTLTAELNGASKSVTVRIVKDKLTSLTVPASLKVGETGVTGSVSRNGANSEALVVNLSSNDTGVVTVPATVTIAAGRTRASFPITVVGAGTAQVVGTAETVVKADTVVVKNFALDRIAMNSNVDGGQEFTVKVYMTDDAASDTVVNLSYSDASLLTGVAAGTQEPATVTILKGRSSVSFKVKAAEPAADSNLTITATHGSPTVSKTDTITIKTLLAPVELSSVTLSAESVRGGGTVTVTVTLTEPSRGGTVVNLTDNSAALSLPDSPVTPPATPLAVTIANGATTGTATVTSSVVANDTRVRVTGQLGTIERTASLNVEAALMTGFATANAGTTNATVSVSNTINFDGTVPANAEVRLSSTSAAAVVPSKVTFVTAGTSIGVSVTTGLVAVDTPYTITASYKGESVTFDGVVRAPVVTLAATPNPVNEGATITATVSISFAVSVDVAVKVNGISATIAAGATSTVVTFPAPTIAEPVATVPSITYPVVATVLGLDYTQNITVTNVA